MLFIQRGGKHFHVAERGIDTSLPEWRKMPYCRNGGMNLKAWEFIELDPVTVESSQVCGACRRRMEANGIWITFGEPYGLPF